MERQTQNTRKGWIKHPVWMVALGLLALTLAPMACGNTAEGKGDKSANAAADKGAGGDKQAQQGDDKGDKAKPMAAAKAPADMAKGLLVAISQFQVDENKKVIPKPGPAKLEIITREGGKWNTQVIEDPDSNVFHKAFYYEPPGGEPGIVTLGGMNASVKIWRKKGGKWTAETIWTKDFGGKFNRMRDAEVGDLYGDGKPVMAVATHDQGIVATISPGAEGKFEVKEIDKKENTFVHEIEIGDIDGDKTLEFYSTPSEPNKLDGSVQTGLVMRYVPSKGGEPTVVANLGNRHAKEILVADVDGDGKDELYVAVEAETEKVNKKIRVKSPVEIRRYDAGTDPTKGVVIAKLKDRLCRFLTYGDVDGDGKKEMVAAPFSSGLWLLRPGSDPKGTWGKTLIDKDSSGFEHTSLLADLDGDGKDELYVASDRQGEVRRYDWNGSGFDKTVISTREVPKSVITWNIMPVPAKAVK